MMVSVSLQNHIHILSSISTSNSTSSSFLFGIGILRHPNFSGLHPLINSQLLSTTRRFPLCNSTSIFHNHNHNQQQHQQRHGYNHGLLVGGGGGGPLCGCSTTNAHLQNMNPPFPALQSHSQSRLMSRITTNNSLRDADADANADADADAGPKAETPTPTPTPTPTTASSEDPFKDGSESESELEVEEEDDHEFGDVDRWDVLGLGQAMVDFSGVVDDEFLESLGLEKGTRKLVNHEERGKVLRAMDGCTYKAAAGGSLSNTLVALARLGFQPVGGPLLNVAMTGSVGSDPLGGFYRNKLRRAGVNFLSAPVKDGTTGTVIVLTTPDAQRTMLAYQGTSSTVNYDPGLSSIVSKTNILVVEGYLFELPDTIKAITRACKDAHSSGALVAVTASDVSCIERHYDNFWEIIGNYADIVFANSDEARALCNFSLKETPVAATRYLSHFVPLVSVTDGPRGSYIGVRGEAVYIPPSPCVPVDTCGAGDAYASGILYGILRGVSDLKDMGTIAARVAAVVVGQQGTRLRVEDAVDLAESFAFHLEDSAI